MSKKNKEGMVLSLGTAGIFGITALVGTFTLGPIDLERTIYNWVIGDIPVIKSKLVDYVREGVKREIEKYNSKFTPGQVEDRLAQELYLPPPNEGEKVNPQDASI